MRIAAGVLLILVALLNGCAGAGVTILGGAASAIGAAAEEAAENTTTTTTEGAEAAAGVEDAANELQSAGGMIMLLGVSLLVLFGLQIAASVCLFTSKAAKFIIIVGVLGIIVPILFMLVGDGSAVPLLASAAISGLAASSMVS